MRTYTSLLRQRSATPSSGNRSLLSSQLVSTSVQPWQGDSPSTPGTTSGDTLISAMLSSYLTSRALSDPAYGLTSSSRSLDEIDGYCSQLPRETHGWITFLFSWLTGFIRTDPSSSGNTSSTVLSPSFLKLIATLTLVDLCGIETLYLSRCLTSSILPGTPLPSRVDT